MNERPKPLAMLADADRNLETPARVTALLRARVAEKQVAPWWRRLRGVWLAGPAAAAALAVAIALWMRPSAQPERKSEVARVVVPEAAATAAPVDTARPVVAPVASVRPPAMRTAATAAALPRASAQTQERITRRFYSLAYAPPELLANSRIVRVRMPRAALISFGMPLDAYQAQGDKVDADVIYTEDGIARAIRFIEERE